MLWYQLFISAPLPPLREASFPGRPNPCPTYCTSDELEPRHKAFFLPWRRQK